MSNVVRLAFRAGFSLCLLSVAVAEAQQGRAAADEIEEILVTGEKLGGSIQDTQASIEVVTGDMLQERNLFDLQDVYLRVPNVNGSVAGDRGFSIRGINFTGVDFSGTGQTASVYVDNVVLTPRYAVFDGPLGAWDVQQIEIYRGPQSTNFGRNALIGAMVVNTKDPTFEWEGAGRVIYAEDNTTRVAGALSGPIVEDELAFRVAAEKFDTDGQVTNVTRGEDDWDHRDRFQGRAKLLWTPAAIPGLTAKISFMHADNERGDDVVVGPDYFDRRALANAPSGEANESQLGSLDLTYELNENWYLKSITAFLENEYTRCEDNDRGPGGPPECNRYRTQEDSIFTQEFRLHYDSDRTRAVAGLYYFDSDEDEVFGIFDVIVIEQPERIENFAVFGEIQHDLTQHWTLTAGFRFDDEQADRAASREFTGIPVPPSSEQSDTSYSEFLPKVGVTYHFTDDQSLSFTFQQAYRAGGSAVNLATGENIEFDPEYTNNYEVAYRSQWMDGRLTFNANAFHIDWKDQQVTVVDPSDELNFFTDNAAESTLQGFEASVTWLAMAGLEIYAGAGYVDTQFEDYFDVGTGTALDGNRFPYAPDASFSGGFTYRNDRGIMAAANVAYQSELYEDIFNTVEVDSFTVVNGRVGYEADRWSVYLYGENLLDEDYITGFFGGTNARLGRPRIFGVQVDARL